MQVIADYFTLVTMFWPVEIEATLYNSVAKFAANESMQGFWNSLTERLSRVSS